MKITRRRNKSKHNTVKKVKKTFRRKIKTRKIYIKKNNSRKKKGGIKDQSSNIPIDNSIDNLNISSINNDSDMSVVEGSEFGEGRGRTLSDFADNSIIGVNHDDIDVELRMSDLNNESIRGVADISQIEQPHISASDNVSNIMDDSFDYDSPNRSYLAQGGKKKKKKRKGGK